MTDCIKDQLNTLERKPRSELMLIRKVYSPIDLHRSKNPLKSRRYPWPPVPYTYVGALYEQLESSPLKQQYLLSGSINYDNLESEKEPCLVIDIDGQIKITNYNHPLWHKIFEDFSYLKRIDITSVQCIFHAKWADSHHILNKTNQFSICNRSCTEFKKSFSVVPMLWWSGHFF